MLVQRRKVRAMVRWKKPVAPAAASTPERMTGGVHDGVGVTAAVMLVAYLHAVDKAGADDQQRHGALECAFANVPSRMCRSAMSAGLRTGRVAV